MYKALIVDDEEEVRVGIVNNIDWQLFGFTISGQAENGREALDFIEEDIPDVVITDITMPLMDGLELTGEIRERYPTVKIVILTGFDEFKFAQQAIKYGVADYLLKPVLPSDIHELMSKLKAQLDTEEAQREDIERLRRYYAESLPVMKENYLSTLLAGRRTEAGIVPASSSFDINLDCATMAAAALRIDGGSLAGSALKGENGELAKVAVLKIAREVLKPGSGEAFFHEGGLALILGFPQVPGQNAINKAMCILEEIRQTVERYLKFTVTIGLGGMQSGIGKIGQSYREALSALEYSVVMGGNRVIYLQDVEHVVSGAVTFDDEKERLFTSSLKFGTEQQVAEAVHTLFSELSGSKVSYMEYQLFLMGMLAAAARTARAFQIDFTEMLGSHVNPYADLFGFKTLDEVKGWFSDVCKSLMQQIMGKRQNSTQALMQKADEYIQKNYSDNGLSIQKLADHLHISSCYLSIIFKKESGETFLKRLVRVRLEAAKELLASTDLKSAEIAERIGYPDINYFSYFFKKNFGMSPREYRAQTRTREDHQP